MNKTTISIDFKNEYKQIPIENIKFVDDIFATYQEGDLIHLISGDDGHYWWIASYHIYWMNAISRNLYSYCTSNKRK